MYGQPKDQKVGSWNPTQDQNLSGVSVLKKYKITLCISHSESLWDRKYLPDLLDQKLWQATIFLPRS